MNHYMNYTVHPKQFLNSLIGKRVRVTLKCGSKYVGTLTRTDNYMNLELDDCVELINDKMTERVMETLWILSNNMLYVHEYDEEREKRRLALKKSMTREYYYILCNFLMVLGVVSLLWLVHILSIYTEFY
ncbi:hypothetical protein CDAR_523391 [Caerostris darwini]|uniref:Sm domain-containing protein n=1 Tax=Caerostris darwini TaxID=1538125 RepID=A0AAV4QMM9_9ARAC|nr:hypothetical protein CDAR_523391 [Caerostris darwini]